MTTFNGHVTNYGHNFMGYYYPDNNTLSLKRYFTNGHQNSEFETVKIKVTPEKVEWLESLDEDTLYFAMEGMFHNG